MKLKSFSLLVLVAALAIVFAGCAQDSTDTSNDNPAMQEAVAKGEGASAAAGAGASETSGAMDKKSTDTSRSMAKGGTGDTKVALSADPTGALKYNKTTLNANAGEVTIAFQNKSSVPHDVTVTGPGDKKLGGTEQITDSSSKLDLKGVKAGTYTFFCSVPGHEQAGMKGTLTVR